MAYQSRTVNDTQYMETTACAAFHSPSWKQERLWLHLLRNTFLYIWGLWKNKHVGQTQPELSTEVNFSI